MATVSEKKNIEVAQQLVQTRNSARGESDDRFVFRYVILYESGYHRFKRGKNKVCCRLIPKVICLLTNAGQTYRNFDIPKTFCASPLLTIRPHCF